MEITLRRIALKSTYTIGKLYVNGKYACDTIEDKDRGLKHGMDENVMKRMKVAGSTAIPYGRYRVYLSVVSPRFGNNSFYKRVCGGMLPRLENVPVFSGVLIHCGNTEKDTDGCILVGQNKEVGKVLNSKVTFERIYNDYLANAKKMGEEVWITIT